MILTYKYRVKDGHARKVLARHAYAVNQVWNYCNAMQRDIESRYRAGAPKRRWPTHFDLTAICKGVGSELGLHQQSVSGVCRQFVQSRNLAKRSLRFRASGGTRRALGWVPFERQSRQVEGNSIWYLGKRYRFFGIKRHPLPDAVTGGCFVEDSLGRWHVCFYVEAPERRCGNARIGIDLGLKLLAAMSNDHKIEAPRHYRNLEAKLAVAQRARNKQRVRRINARIKNARRDFLHKLSTELVRENKLIVIGNVSSSRLAKTRFAKSVLDAGWSAFRSMLSYKCQQAAASFREVDEAFTTQTCSSCGVLPPERPKGIAGLGIRHWECSSCGASHDRDVNAARNILVVALSAERPVEGSQSNRIGTRETVSSHDNKTTSGVLK